MLISIKIYRNSAFLGSYKHKMLFVLPINVKMQTFVGILTFMNWNNFMLMQKYQETQHFQAQLSLEHFFPAHKF